ncbi:unnamed protein product [Ixodes persulcatus]
MDEFTSLPSNILKGASPFEFSKLYFMSHVFCSNIYGDVISTPYIFVNRHSLLAPNLKSKYTGHSFLRLYKFVLKKP